MPVSSNGVGRVPPILGWYDLTMELVWLAAVFALGYGAGFLHGKAAERKSRTMGG